MNKISLTEKSLIQISNQIHAANDEFCEASSSLNSLANKVKLKKMRTIKKEC